MPSAIEKENPVPASDANGVCANEEIPNIVSP
jgi:hypothetical protein